MELESYLTQLCEQERVHIVFVCLGNICRSPLAEGIANALYAQAPNTPSLEFSSAGTSGFHNGDPIDARSIAIARENGIDIAHYTSKQVSPYAHSDVDLFVAMDRSNLAALKAMGFESRKIVLLGDFGLGGAEVPDPYYGGADGFKKVYAMLHNGIADLLGRFKR
ncbi:low molecular weight protein-tyrosine-phosphatase [Helicobacter canis]|uniref:low molecular weight protein-tyrosine-phosphatase n=1 Tax=Helicobacter canis TaxID=29419 RepID=UPI0026EE02FA|nr:low molecular weight protein-tyrosine-phosphatase [Helicobacter canis]